MNACPMDGGGLVLDAQGKLQSAWRRDGTVFLAPAGGKEAALGKGKNVTLAVTKAGPYAAWQDGMNVVVKKPGAARAAVAGMGAFPVLASSGDAVFAAWEHSGSIAVERVQ